MLVARHRRNITIAPRHGRLPASFAQEERLVAGRHTHIVNNIVTLGLRIDGPLDVDALEQVIALMVRRHEGLRITFPEDDTLRVLPDIPQPLIACHADSDEQALDLLAQVALEPFDLAAGPLFRCALVRVHRQRHFLGIVLDQYVVDRWAVSLLLNELLVVYDAIAKDTPPDLPESPIQFPDYAAWERDYLTGKNFERLLGYWRDKLAGVDPIPASGLTDPDAPVNAPVALARATAEVDHDLTARLTELAQQHTTSLVVVFSAATKAAAWRRMAGCDVTTFGSLANRVMPGTENLVGYLATPAVLRTDLSGDPSFDELVRREARTFWEAMWHQQIPHALITRELAPHQYGIRHRGGGAPIPRYLNFDLADDRNTRLRQPDGISVETVRVRMPEVPRGGLRVIVHKHARTATVELRYRTDCYGKQWADSFVTDMLACLEQPPATRLSRALP